MTMAAPITAVREVKVRAPAAVGVAIAVIGPVVIGIGIRVGRIDPRRVIRARGGIDRCGLVVVMMLDNPLLDHHGRTFVIGMALSIYGAVEIGSEAGRAEQEQGDGR
jgi:hypothetical protein